ncbi:MAG: F0F1 ATP synthase subunit delta [Prevotella sp.]|jgi:F-type H+-transporting ATPase subunit delta|nr:F0F1 ATP synthase subunit delta [Prevotella sp.]
METGVISVRYARALLKSATELNIEKEVYQEMTTLVQSFIKVPELRFTIDNPMLAKDKKKSLLATACGGGVTPLTERFIQLVLSEDRESNIHFMAASYTTLYRKQYNITRGRLITAVPVTPLIEKKMRQKVESRTNGTVEFQTEVNPEIIGGYILEYDTYRLDASIQNQLRTILAQLCK